MTDKMNIIDFLDTFNNGYWEPITLELGGTRKKVSKVNNHGVSYMPDPRDTLEMCKKRQPFLDEKGYIWFKTTKDMMVLDVDFKEGVEYTSQAELLVEKMKRQFPWTKSVSKPRGCHIFFKPSKEFLANLKTYTEERQKQDTKFKGKYIKYKANHPLFGLEVLTGFQSYQKVDFPVQNVKSQEVLPKTSLPLEKDDLQNAEDSYEEAGKEDVIKLHKIYYDIKASDYIINKEKSGFTIYHYENGFWGETRRPYDSIRADMADVLEKELLKRIKATKKPSKKLVKAYESIATSANARAGVVSNFIDLLIKNRKTNTEMDENQHLFHFENKCFNLETLRFEKNLKEHHATIHAPALQERCPTAEAELKRVIKSIFPEDDIRKDYMTIQANMLSGKPLEKFIIFNGGGGNGKGVMIQINEAFLGDYFYKGNITTLTQKRKTGSSPEIANMDLKRLVIFEEPDADDCLQFGTIKDITGGETINARLNHANNCKVRMAGIKALCMNGQPKINGVQDNAMFRRALDLFFGQTFKDKDDTTRFEGDGCQDADPRLKSKKFITSLKSSMFWLIHDHMIKEKFNFDNLHNLRLCKKVTDRTKAYLESNNELLQHMLGIIVKQKVFVDENGDNKVIDEDGIPRDPNMLKIKDIVSQFKKTETYKLMTPTEQKNYIPKCFTKSIMDDRVLGRDYVREHKRVKNILQGWEFIKEEENNEEEEGELVDSKCLIGD